MTTPRVLVSGQLRISEPCDELTDNLRRTIGDLVHECRRARKPCVILHEQGNLTRILGRT